MGFTSHEIKQIGYSQHFLCWGVLANIICVCVIPRLSPICGIFLLYSLWKLCKGLQYSTILSVLLCLLMFIPLVSIITLLVMNAKATAVLRGYGMKVGFMGASKEDLDALED